MSQSDKFVARMPDLLDPAAIMAEHCKADHQWRGYDWCASCGWQSGGYGFTPWPCQPFTLAAEVMRLRGQVEPGDQSCGDYPAPCNHDPAHMKAGPLVTEDDQR